MFVSIKPGNGPMHVQLRQQIRGLIAEGVLPPGSRLPSSRALAALVGVSRNTVLAVYESLVADGVLESRERAGTFVADPRGTSAGGECSPCPADRTAGAVNWESLLSNSSRALAALPPRARVPGPGRRGVVLSRLVPWWDEVSAERMRLCVNYVLQRDGNTLLGYGETEGYLPLREWLASYMCRKGVPADAGDVLVVSGFQQGMDLICRTLLSPGDVVLTENPTYAGAFACLRAAGARISGIPVTPAGLDLGVLAEQAERQRPKMVYVMPTFHNPTGYTMDLSSRLKLLELADRYGFVIVEDGYCDDLCHSGSFIPPIKAHDRSGRVLYLNSMSKLLFPGMRIGWVVAARPVLGALVAIKRAADLNCSPILQAALHEFCRMGYLRAHLARARRVYRSRRETMVKAMKQYFPPGVTWHAAEGALVAWVTLPPAVDCRVLLADAARAGVWFAPGVDFFVDGGGEHNLRLSWCNATPAEITTGVRILGQLLRARMQAPSGLGDASGAPPSSTLAALPGAGHRPQEARPLGHGRGVAPRPEEGHPQ